MTRVSTPAPNGASTLTTKDDADILAAWQRLAANRVAAAELDHEAAGYDEEEERLWSAIDKDEGLITKAVATTLTGAEIQLWCILSHDCAREDDELAVFRRDIEHFANNGRFDLPSLIALQAIRSLRAMGGEA